MAKPTAGDRFWARVDKRGPDECWPWIDRLDRDGYGTFKVLRRPKRAHRFAYELLVGPILEGHTLDHACHTRDPSCPGGHCPHRRCVNPAHLVPMTPNANVTANRERKTHCKHGHEFTPENTRWKRHRNGETYRECRVCHNERARRANKRE